MSRILIDAYQKLSAEMNQLMNNYASLRVENKDLEVSNKNLKIFITDLKDQVLTLKDAKVALEMENKKIRDALIRGKELATKIQEKLESD